MYCGSDARYADDLLVVVHAGGGLLVDDYAVLVGRVAHAEEFVHCVGAEAKDEALEHDVAVGDAGECEPAEVLAHKLDQLEVEGGLELADARQVVGPLAARLELTHDLNGFDVGRHDRSERPLGHVLLALLDLHALLAVGVVRKAARQRREHVREAEGGVDALHVGDDDGQLAHAAHQRAQLVERLGHVGQTLLARAIRAARARRQAEHRVELAIAKAQMRLVHCQMTERHKQNN